MRTYTPSYQVQLKNITFVRALLITGCVGIILLITGGFIDGSHQLSLLMGGQNEETVIESFEEHNYFKEKTATVIHDDYHHDTHSHQGNGKTHHHDHGGEADWIRYTLLVMFSIILIIVIVAKEHFLEEHLWEHVIKVHLPKYFMDIRCYCSIDNFEPIHQHSGSCVIKHYFSTDNSTIGRHYTAVRTSFAVRIAFCTRQHTCQHTSCQLNSARWARSIAVIG